MKKMFMGAAIAAVALFAVACNPKGEEPKGSSNAKIESFALNLSYLDQLEDKSIKAGVSVEIVGEEIQINIPFGLKPDTIKNLFDANAAVLTLSDEATVSPASGTAVKFNSKTPVYYYVTAQDGVAKTAYRVKIFEKTNHGYGSMSLYWEKNGTQFSNPFTNNNEKTFALTKNEVIAQFGGMYDAVALKLVRLSLLDGSEIGNVDLKVSDTQNITTIRAMAGDKNESFIGCDIAAPNADFIMWIWDTPTSAPRQLIKWNVSGLTPVGTLPNQWANYFVGRRIAVSGNLKTGDAYIYTFACYTMDILRWKVTNGTVANQTPEIIKFTAGGTMTRFENWASIYPLGNMAASDFIVNATNAGSEVTFVNGSTKQPRMTATAVATPKGIASYIEFNNAKYYVPLNTDYASAPNPMRVNARLYDYTATTTSAQMADNWWLNPQPKTILQTGTLVNGDMSGCVDCILSPDGESFLVVAMGTGCGYNVHKFDKRKEMTF